MEIRILGSDCSKCNTLYRLVSQVVSENEIKAEVIKTGDIAKIMEYKILSLPALVINDKVVSEGILPTKNEILNLIDKHL